MGAHISFPKEKKIQGHLFWGKSKNLSKKLPWKTTFAHFLWKITLDLFFLWITYQSQVTPVFVRYWTTSRYMYRTTSRYMYQTTSWYMYQTTSQYGTQLHLGTCTKTWLSTVPRHGWVPYRDVVEYCTQTGFGTVQRCVSGAILSWSACQGTVPSHVWVYVPRRGSVHVPRRGWVPYRNVVEYRTNMGVTCDCYESTYRKLQYLFSRLNYQKQKSYIQKLVLKTFGYF